MNQRDRWRRRKAQRKIVASEPPPPSDAGATTGGGRLRRVLIVAIVVTLCVVSYRKWTASQASDPAGPIAKSTPRDPEPDETDSELPHGHPPIEKPIEKDDPDDFLKAFNAKDAKSDKEGGPTQSSEELERKFETFVALNDRIETAKKRAIASGLEPSPADIREVKALMKPYEKLRGELDKELRQAKQARPDDALVRWLTGELFARAGGEPAQYLPDLQFAATHGLKRPRLLATIAVGQLDSNHFEEAYRSAVRSLDQGAADRYVWNVFIRVANSTNRFDEVIARLDRAFPAGVPDWAKESRADSVDLRAKWNAEEKIRQAEAKANDLPRVRLVIEHRRFAKDAAGKPLTAIESTGREEVVLELFENEAPLTVANFLDLVSRKFYDGTTFHIALPASKVVGGDPNTKNDDPADDGQGGPGYVIPDEFGSPKARNHFRGSLTMVNKGRPHTAGSQFAFCLQPDPELDGQLTVFGRVFQGQAAIDRVTRGRTYKANEFHIGRIIPGDLLVRAEVIRKRPHEYKAVKEQP